MTGLVAAQAVIISLTGQAQVTLQQVTNGLVDYYPLDSVSGSTTPDLISRRDLTLVNMTAGNIVAASHPGINQSNTCMNFSQSGGATVAYYATTGQFPSDGSGDFLPFINQRGATMNFWVKTYNTSGNEQRVMAECANDGQSSPFFSISDKGSASVGTNASFFLRAANNVTDSNGVSAYLMSDGTYEDPVIGYLWNQGANDTASNVFDGTWHMLTMEISTNGDMHIFVDGNYDQGDQAGSAAPFTDNEGNLTVAPSMSVTNTYYNNNIYPTNQVAHLSTNGYISWLVPDLCNSGKTTFGGYIRNNAIAGGVVGQMSDIGFWNRTLSTNEILFVMTNGLPGLTLNTNTITISKFGAGIDEVGQGGSVTLSWNVTGASSSPGGIVISGVGDVSALGGIGSTNITLTKNQTYSFTLTAHNGLVQDQHASANVLVLPGVSPNWNLIQRFDGVFANTATGVNSNGWTTLQSIYSGTLDRFNVVTVNGNKALSPKSGYVPDANVSFGYDTEGALTYGQLNNLTIPPNQNNTLFFRFSLQEPPAFYTGTTNIYSGLDLGLGLTDFGFATGPLGETQPPGTGGTYGPGFHIVNYDPSGSFQTAPFDLMAVDYSGSAYTNSYDYLTDAVNGNTNGLMTNVNYFCWLDVSNFNTMGVLNNGVTNTVNEPVFSLWIQAQGATNRTLLFSGFHGDRDYSQYGVNSDYPTPYLDKVFASVGTEAFQSGQNGAFFATNNMVLLDDFYMSANGFNSTVPRLFNIRSIVRGSSAVTIQWDSLGSLFQTNTYSVQRTLSLHNPAWTTLTNGLPSGGDMTSFTDSTIGTANNAFYRISWP